MFKSLLYLESLNPRSCVSTGLLPISFPGLGFLPTAELFPGDVLLKMACFCRKFLI